MKIHVFQKYCPPSPPISMFETGGGGTKIRFFQQGSNTFVRDCSFNTLLGKDDSVSIHAKNLQTLLIEMFKTKENINPLS